MYTPNHLSCQGRRHRPCASRVGAEPRRFDPAAAVPPAAALARSNPRGTRQGEPPEASDARGAYRPGRGEVRVDPTPHTPHPTPHAPRFRSYMDMHVHAQVRVDQPGRVVARPV